MKHLTLKFTDKAYNQLTALTVDMDAENFTETINNSLEMAKTLYKIVGKGNEFSVITHGEEFRYKL